jgi:hypothetical protein
MDEAAAIVQRITEQTSGTPWHAKGNYVNGEAGPVAVAYQCWADAGWMALLSPEAGSLLAAVLKDAAETWKTEVRAQADGWYHEACDGVSGEDCTCFTRMLALAGHIRDKAAGRG